MNKCAITDRYLGFTDRYNTPANLRIGKAGSFPYVLHRFSDVLAYQDKPALLFCAPSESPDYHRPLAASFTKFPDFRTKA
jgi:hypothetical protein